MDAPSDVDLEPARAASRAAAEYLLRSLAMLADLSGDDPLTGLISLAIVQGNVAHLPREGASAYATVGDIPPDEVRRPVSIAAVAAALHLPYETTRRRVMRLIELGLCERKGRGVIVPVRVLDSDRHVQMLQANLVNLRRLKRALEDIGV